MLILMMILTKVYVLIKPIANNINYSHTTDLDVNESDL